MQVKIGPGRPREQDRSRGTVGRLSGDRVVHALGGRMVLLFGGSCAAGGVALAVLAPAWSSALAGFALVGLGAANIVPVLFSAVGRQHAMPANLAIGAVTTLGYAGILAGPAGIGFVAHAAGLPTAFLGVAALLLVVAACSSAVTREDEQAASRKRVAS